jgi:hypothetical protein
MSDESEIEWKVEIRNNIEVPGNMVPILTIHPDGRVIVSDRLKPEKTAELVLDQIKKQWLEDAQVAKIRELKSDVNELNELVEYLQNRVKKLKAAGNELIEYVREGTSESNYRLLVDAWEKAKGKL